MKEWLYKLWEDYIRITPDALKIHEALNKRGETIVNDHIAIRTFNGKGISLKDLSRFIMDKGYNLMDSYSFEGKKLKAQSFKHPDPLEPKVFISELLTEEFSNEFQEICNDLMIQSQNYMKNNKTTLPLKPWNSITYSQYRKLMKESDYAGWVSSFGIRANHFTVFINELKTFNAIEEVNDFLKSEGFILNDKGGEIKGSKEEFLKQSSTMAKTIQWDFADGTYDIASCFYEFAERFPVNSKGDLFDGFIVSSADKIFESTDINSIST